MAPPVLLSARPGDFAFATRVAPGVELKLDRQHVPDLGDSHTLTDVCEEHGLDPAAVGSVHLPPGTTDSRGMTVASGNVGAITDFTHTAFGSGVDPDWLTLHSDRAFDYRAHVDALGTITDITGYPVALESGTDRGQFHHPEHMAVFAFLARHVDHLANTYILIDTAHIPDHRTELTVSDDKVDDILDEMDAALRDRVEDPFHAFLQDRVAQAAIDLDPGDPWRPALVALHMIGGDRVRAVHLNDPDDDGVPDVENGAPEGMQAVVGFCRQHDAAFILEPDDEDEDWEIEAVLDWLIDAV